MRLRLADHVRDAEYIRYARLETLKSLQVDPDPSLLNIIPISKYVLAEDSRNSRPIGMGESAMLSDVYDSYDDTPYREVGDLSTYCPLSQMAGMRTVFVEREYRTSNSLFMAITLASAKLFYGYGARFATASTRAADEYLNRLYAKWGGDRVGTFCTEDVNEPTSLFVFDLTRMLNHRVMQRVARYVTFDFADAVAS